MNRKTIVGLAIVVAVAAFVVITAPQLWDTVEKGTFQVKQAAITGTMSAKMTPGLWWQLFGDIVVWPRAETFYFTADVKEGERFDQSIEIRFNDGSIANISGTLRVFLPSTAEEAIGLVTDMGYRNYKDLEQKLILPVTRNALRLTANLMTAKESYSEKRSNFIFWSWDQIQNGLYETEEVITEVEDPISGKMTKGTLKVIKRNPDGTPKYQKNPFERTGIRLANFEIKTFVYDNKVKDQIATQQEAYMAVATARAQAEKAKEDRRTIEEQGKAEVTRAQYEKEKEKIQAIVQAQRDKETAVIAAEKRKAVAQLDREAAALEKERQILLGQGEAERKRLVLEADGALKQKLDTLEKIMGMWAEAYKERKVPNVMIGGESGQSLDRDALNFETMLSLLVMDKLGLELTVPKGRSVQ